MTDSITHNSGMSCKQLSAADSNLFRDFLTQVRVNFPAFDRISSGDTNYAVHYAAALEQLYASTEFLRAMGFNTDARLVNMAVDGNGSSVNAFDLDRLSYRERLREESILAYRASNMEIGYRSAVEAFERHVERPIKMALGKIALQQVGQACERDKCQNESDKPNGQHYGEVSGSQRLPVVEEAQLG